MSSSRIGELLLVGAAVGTAVALLWAFAPALRAAPRLSYPPAARDALVDDYHGTQVADPYRWLEDLDSPRTRAWLQAEAQLTERYFADLPGRERLRERLSALYGYEKVGVPFTAGKRYFFTSNSGHQDQSVLYVSDALHGKPVLALDPNALPGAGHPVVVGYVASRDGRRVAYGVSSGGSDWTDWHVRDLASGRDLDDVLRFTKYYRPVFAPDGKGLYYSAFPAPPAGAELSTEDKGNAVYYHALGTPGSADRQLLSDAAHPDWQYEPHLTPDGRWLVVLAGEGEVGDKALEDVYLVDLAASPAVPIPVSVGFQAAFIYVGADAGRLFFLTSLHAPNGRVVALEPRQAAAGRWQEVIPEGADAIDLGIASRSVTLVGHRLFVRTLHDAHARVVAYQLDGTQPREVPFAGPGTVTGFDGEPEDGETFFSYSNAITPPTVFRYDVGSGDIRVFFTPRVAFEPKDFEQRQVFYTAKDGSRIPMLLAYRKGLRLDGENPLLLYGYGGFGISLTPAFNPGRIAWLEMGGVYATANIRGGGEYGEVWHRQGTLTHKQVVFDDFIAAARWLIAERYTAPSRLAIQGASNGGLLAGACVTQQPQLFGAAIVQVGVLDMLRFNRFGQGAGWEGDYGSPQDPQLFAALRAYSPVHNVHPGTRYPAIMVITGDHDTRVMPMHSFKFAAALQAAQASPAPVLLAVRLSSGHGGGETVSQAVQQSADVYAFLAKNLHMQFR